MITHVDIWSDGSCAGNPGPGGFAALVKLGGRSIAVCGYEEYTTNNRMELRGFLSGLLYATEDHDPKTITIYTDSKYIENAINCKWLDRWELTEYKGIKNCDLWRLIYKFIKAHNVKVVWVKGHADNVNNGIVDTLAVEARLGAYGDYHTFSL